MTSEEFLRRFQLQSAPSVQRPQVRDMRPAAVLIPVWEQAGQLQLVLTQRAAQLRHHGGQISFPGGRQDQADSNLLATALREAHEEIGLHPDDVSIVGQLRDYPVISNFNVRPFVAMINPRAPFVADANEVAEIFTVPLIEVLRQEQHFAYRLQRFLYDRVYFIPYQQRNIWGATAGMIRELADHVYPEHQRLHKDII